MSNEMNRDNFAKQEGTKFSVFLDSDEATEFELTEVSEVSKTDRTKGFSLVFHAPADAVLVTGTVKMEHDELGQIDIGISPFDQDENNTKYEAVFSDLIGEPEAPPPTPESAASLASDA